jgi:hypothetical protein
MPTLSQVKLSDLATCSPSSTLRLDMVDKKSDETDVAGLPRRSDGSKTSGSVAEVSASDSDDFIRIRRVSIYLHVLAAPLEVKQLLAGFYDLFARPHTNVLFSSWSQSSGRKYEHIGG